MEKISSLFSSQEPGCEPYTQPEEFSPNSQLCFPTTYYSHHFIALPPSLILLMTHAHQKGKVCIIVVFKLWPSAWSQSLFWWVCVIRIQEEPAFRGNHCIYFHGTNPALTMEVAGSVHQAARFHNPEDHIISLHSRQQLILHATSVCFVPTTLSLLRQWKRNIGHRKDVRMEKVHFW